MSSTLNRDLESLGCCVLRRRAALRLLWCATAILSGIALLGFIDLFFRVQPAGRWISGLTLLLMSTGAFVWISALVRQKYSPEAVAALMERTFPELDNHLINYVQFARRPDCDPFTAAYLTEGAPPLKRLDISRLDDHRRRRRGLLVLGAVLAVLLLPLPIIGRAWPVAVWRMLNPLATTEPVTLTRLLAVEPGDKIISQGDHVVLSAHVVGRPGHDVRLDFDPEDADRTTYVLGRITRENNGEHTFMHRAPPVYAAFRYRIRAGDAAPSPWYQIVPRPPTSLKEIQLSIRPPEYTGLPATILDPREERATFPEGSDVRLRFVADAPLEYATLLKPGDDEPLSMQAVDGDREIWQTDWRTTASGMLRLSARDEHEAALSESLAIRVLPDKPPGIEILEPTGQVLLPTGESPRIRFRVTDDYGLGEVRIERFDPDSPGAEPEIVARREGEQETEIHQAWTGAPQGRRAVSMHFRIVARDNNPFADNLTRSAPIVFAAPPHDGSAVTREQFERQAATLLNRLIDLQRANVNQTQAYRQKLENTGADSWNVVLERQQTIRSITRELLSNPARPLGTRTTAINALYVNEMSLAIHALEGIYSIDPTERENRSARALSLQETILRQLTGVHVVADRSLLDRRVSRLEAMLDAIIKGQARVLVRTRSRIERDETADIGLVSEQDDLSSDVADFTRACLREAQAATASAPAFADLLSGIAAQAEDRSIRNDMLLAAERLERNMRAEAVTLGERAHENLLALREQLEGMAVARDLEREQLMLEALAQARKTVERVTELHQRIIEGMDAVRGATDFNDEFYDALFEEYREVASNTRDAMLEVPNDLHLFGELNAANELVEDIFSVYEEIEQVAGSEQWTAKDALEFAYVKEDILLDMMGEVLERIDEIETWLADHPTGKVTTEAFDLEELPESGVAMAPLAAQVQDLISDLLEESREHAEATHDAASTHAVSDIETGWMVEEGDIVTFSGKGKTGSERPDHKEQDGRSYIGREGMAVGETAAGGGTIEEGDPNIAARRTEDPTQGGRIDLEGEAQTVATGGGKQATGKADDFGMDGGVARMDSTEAGSWEGMAALLARQADAVYARASLQDIRVDSLKNAAHHLRQAGDAIAKGHIEQVRELRQLAVAELRQSLLELDAGPSAAIDMTGTPRIFDGAIDSGPDQAPPRYRRPVAEYFKLLNEAF